MTTFITRDSGHNWGSEHDPSTDECAPNSFDGGKHVMYTYSVSGYNPNNKVTTVYMKTALDGLRASLGAMLD